MLSIKRDCWSIYNTNCLIMIPKIIHYCWLSGDPIPDKLQKCMSSWKSKLPDYEFILWDLNRFDINQSLWVKQAFESKKYAFAADYIRLYAVYNYGGFYLDMDVEVVKSLNSLLDSSYVFGFEDDEGVEAGVFGAEKGFYLLKECMKYYEYRKFILSPQVYDTKPLPLIMYEVFCKRHEVLIRSSLLVPDELNIIWLFPNEFLTAKSFETGKINKTTNTYTIHHFAGSWLSWNARVVYFFVRVIGVKNVKFLIKAKQVICRKLIRL